MKKRRVGTLVGHTPAIFIFILSICTVFLVVPLVADVTVVLKVHGVRVRLVRDFVRSAKLGDESRIP
jgi:hypothetical protein